MGNQEVVLQLAKKRKKKKRSGIVVNGSDKTIENSFKFTQASEDKTSYVHKVVKLGIIIGNISSCMVEKDKIFRTQGTI